MDSSSVLIVEDDKAIRGLVRKVLESHGLHVKEAETADDGVAQLAGVGLVLLDLTLVGKNGKVFLKALKNLGLDLPVVIMSGADPESRKDLREFRISYWLKKPFEMEELVAVTGRAMKAARSITTIRTASSGLDRCIWNLTRLLAQ